MNLIEFGTISHIKKGKKPLRQVDKPQDGYMPYVDIEAFETGNIKMYTDGEKCLPCKAGDILIVCDGSRSGFVGKAIDGYVGSTLAIISADGMSQEYLYYFLQGKYALLNTKKKGTGTPHLDANILNQQKLLVPSLEEQKRIVAKIEELFSELDNGVETLKKTKQQLAVYRQAVLKSAFSDILLNEYKPLKTVFLDSPQNGLYKPKTAYGSGTQILRIDGFYDGRILDDYNFKRLALNEFEVEQYQLNKWDLIVNRVNSMPYLGKCALVRDLTEITVYESNMMRIRLDSTKIDPEYVTYYLSSFWGRKELIKNAKQAVNQASINQTDVGNTLIPVPEKLECQRKTVSVINARMSVCDNIEKTVDTALQQAEAMRQSILKKAFEGRI